nr:GTP cyclohydrolase 1 feedback regulatory protein-like [Procambarus clarkii]XP_045612158.1 GTP cyclohydrolase 1 feedback regulatory protein-like [Procambarus clarkii]
MPYLLISTQLKLDTGPTYVGDSESDLELMNYLQAEVITEPTSKSFSYSTKLVPRKVLNLLEVRGWQVVSSASIGQTCIWTLHIE